MSNEQKMMEEALLYAQEVHAQMHGFYKEGTVPGVRDESRNGALGKYCEQRYHALGRLGERFGFDGEDEDRGDLLNALEELLLENSVKMFEYGMKYAQGKM